jgi:hypothetical protein
VVDRPVGVRADGTKELIARTDGYREPCEAWTGLLRDCARRGMRAPVLAVGDSALGFWNAVSEVFPDNRRQRCWVHKTAKVLDALPKSTRPAAKRAGPGDLQRRDKELAARAVHDFERAYGAMYPKAVKRITDDEEFAEIEELAGAAPPGPWHVRQLDDFAMSLVAISFAPSPVSDEHPPSARAAARAMRVSGHPDRQQGHYAAGSGRRKSDQSRGRLVHAARPPGGNP